jgi:hypothetical protein
LYLTTPTGELGNTPDGDRSAVDNHNRALTWYVGTANLSSGQIPSTVIVTRPAEVYRRLGDLVAAGYKDPKQTWYTPSQTDANFAHGDKNAPWEGIGTGWFNSVLGGGATNQVRPANNTSTIRLKVSEDNLQGPAPMHGDYAVSTLFNGNFDAVSPSWDPTGSTQSIAGWSIDSNAQQQHLERVNKPNNSSLALKLGGTGGINQIAHNPFVVTDWGSLRFDLYTGDVDKGASPNQLEVFLDEVGSTNTKPIQIIELREAEATWGVKAAADYASDRWRIGYGEIGFETFMIDVPDALRGKAATLRFKLNGDKPVYLDNVFFKSQHLFLGNPTEARQPDSAGSYIDNYLLEKPQFTVSYNENTKTPNWVAWQLNKSWLGSESKRPDFFADPALTNDFTLISHDDYLRTGYDRGHLAPSAHRKRDLKDNIATFLTTNILPQSIDNNQLFFKPKFDNSAWYKLETRCSSFSAAH